MTNFESLSVNLQRLLVFIQDYIRDHGYAPSVRDIGGALCIPSTSTVHAQLKQLEDAGLLKRSPSKPRAMVVQISPSEAPSSVSIPDSPFKERTGQSEQPLFDTGQISLPFVPFDEIEKTFSLSNAYDDEPALARWTIPAGILADRSYFITVMPDDSMINRQISAGDFLVVSRQDSAINNDMIIGSLHGETLIRSYTKGLRQVRLQVESNDFVIATVNPEDLTIYGIVVAYLHTMA